MNNLTKTNAIRLLEAAGIPHEIREYEVDESDLSGTTVARKTGLEPECVFKTLVAVGDKNGICVFCIPVNCELDLKKAATASGNKKVEMLHLNQLLPTTGYIRGGCSPVGMKKSYPTYIDESCVLWDTIALSAGARGMQMLVAPDNIIALCSMITADITV